MSQSVNKVRAKKNAIMGAVEAVVAVLYIIAVFILSPSNINWMFLALSIGLLGLGVFNILFYPFIFPKKLAKAAQKVYLKSIFKKPVSYKNLLPQCFITFWYFRAIFAPETKLWSRSPIQNLIE